MQGSANSQMTVVTGAAGFIGSYLVKQLLAQGVPASSLLAVDELALFENRRCCENFKKQGIRLMDPKEFMAQFSAGHIPAKIVFHIGACSNTDEFREDYLREVNIKYSRDMWTACTRLQVPLLYASSAATYGDGNQGFSDAPEKIPQLRPLNPYGWSKQYFDLFVLEEVAKKKTPPFWAGFKFFNVYGPGEDHKGRQASVLFHARLQYQEKGFLKLFRSHRDDVADGEQKRDFIWIGDITDALITFSHGQLASGIYNLGTGQARTFLDLARSVAQALKRECKVEFIDTPEHLRKGYQYFTQAELDHLRAAGYSKPFTSLEDGAKKYVQEWNW
jgi:ADP-L-glycero-D-manno-heptose 6-epimerase